MLVHIENDKPIICYCNIMQCFPGLYPLDKEQSKIIFW